MGYKNDIRQKAIVLRRQGLSVKAVAQRLGISAGTSSLWLRDVRLSKALRAQLAENSRLGREKGRKIMRQNREKEWAVDCREATATIAGAHRGTAQDWRYLAAILYWCEGGKRGCYQVQFTNSDPQMVKIFLIALRKGFSVKEAKLRALVHLHEYHDSTKQLEFWSKVTDIPLRQFSRSYVKPHTGKRKRLDYPGCISIRYGSSRLAQKLKAVYYVFADKHGGLFQR